MNIDHIVLWVDNQQHSLAFFVDLLGMHEAARAPPLAWPTMPDSGLRAPGYKFLNFL